MCSILRLCRERDNAFFWPAFFVIHYIYIYIYIYIYRERERERPLRHCVFGNRVYFEKCKENTKILVNILDKVELLIEAAGTHSKRCFKGFSTILPSCFVN